MCLSSGAHITINFLFVPNGKFNIGVPKFRHITVIRHCCKPYTITLQSCLCVQYFVHNVCLENAENICKGVKL